MGPPVGATQQEAKAKLDEAKQAVEELDKRGFDSTDAKGWYQQAESMYSNNLFKTAIIYAGYSLAASSEALETIKYLDGLIQSTLTRAVSMLGREHPDMSKVSDLLKQAKQCLNSGDAVEARELIRAADDTVKGIQTPYATATTSTVGVSTVKPSRGYSSCPSCGNIVESTWTECKYCGVKLSQDQATGPGWTKAEEGPVLQRVTEQPPVEDQLEEAEEELEQVESEYDRVEADLEKPDEDRPTIIPKIPKFDELGNSRPEDVTPEPPGPQELKCPNCGEEVEEDWTKCPVCKAELNQ
jgi:hypothetical protein